MILYIQLVLLILFGAFLNEAGVKITNPFFWLLVTLLLGIILTFDIMSNPEDEEEVDEKNKDQNNKGT